MTKNALISMSLFLAMALFAACSSDDEKPVKAKKDRIAATADEDKGDALAIGLARPRDDAEYAADGPEIPARVGVTRRFLRRSQTNTLRDPAMIPGTNDVLVVGRVGPVPGIWRLNLDKPDAATPAVTKPLFDSKKPVTAKNRQDWFFGTPRAFPNGKFAIFDGARNTPNERFGHVLGLVDLANGSVEAIEVEGTPYARCPDVAPDGETVIVSSCTEIRAITLKGMGSQKLASRVIVSVPTVPEIRKGHLVCTVHRPRFSKDGKRIVFEGIGQFMSDEIRAEYAVPDSINAGDYAIEPWIVNTDGTGLRRLISDDAYAMIDGRVQTGGSKEPDFSPDGQSVVFSHGKGIAVVSVDGKSARMIVTGVPPGGAKLTFEESDPVYSPDGKKVIATTVLVAGEDQTRIAPPGVAVVDLVALDALGSPE